MAEPKPEKNHKSGEAYEKWERFKDFTRKIAQAPEEVDKECEKKRAI